MSLSRERAVELSHRMIERVQATPGLELLNEREFVRNQILQALLSWDRESDRLAAGIRQKLSGRARAPVEGSREWDLLFAEEMEKALVSLLGRGE